MPYTDVRQFVQQFEDFQQYSPEAQQVALDTFNGAVYNGAPEGEAIKQAHAEASRVDEAEARGRSSETLPRGGSPRMGGGQQRPSPRGGATYS